MKKLIILLFIGLLAFGCTTYKVESIETQEGIITGDNLNEIFDSCSNHCELKEEEFLKETNSDDFVFDSEISECNENECICSCIMYYTRVELI